MGSKGRIPTYQRRPFFGPGMLHPDAITSSEIMEQKLFRQHDDMQMLVTENERLATTHFTLRQELTAAQQELQRLQSHMSTVQTEQEQQMRVMLDRKASMEADMQGSESVKVEYKQACAEADGLAAGRQELILKIQQLTHDLQKSNGDVEQVPALMSELDALRQEYQHYRAVYDYEKKLFADHYESLQVMERNYVTMVQEVEKLRSELANATSLEKSGQVYGSSGDYKESDASGPRSVEQNAYEDGHGVSQVRWPPSVNVGAYGGGPPASAPPQAGYDAHSIPGYGSYGAPRNTSYDPSLGVSYNAPKGGAYEAPRGGGYEVSRGGGPGVAPTRGAGGAQFAASTPGGISDLAHGSGQAANPYRPMQTNLPSYGLGQAPNPYSSTQTIPPPHGYGSTPTQTDVRGAQVSAVPGGISDLAYVSAQAANPLGPRQTNVPPYGSGQAQNPYGSTPKTTPPYGSRYTPTATDSNYEAPHGGNVAGR